MTEFLDEKGGKSLCPNRPFDLDAMLKYIRAVVSRLMIYSNTSALFYTQSYIPIGHIIYKYCQHYHQPLKSQEFIKVQEFDTREGASLRGALIYFAIDAFVRSYVVHMQQFLMSCPQANFLTVYIREWKIYKRGANYNGRMLRYLSRHWIKREIDEGQPDIYEISELFLIRWRTIISADIIERIKGAMNDLEASAARGRVIDSRVEDAVNESLKCRWQEFLTSRVC